MAILITGGAGYIGSHTMVEFLNAGRELVVVDNFMNSKPEALERVRKITGKDFKFFQVDLLDKEALDKVVRENNIDSCIHFAGLKAVGESCAKPMLYYHNNITGTLNLCEVLAKYGAKRIVFSSSATVYGNPASVPITEDFPLSTTNPYGETKLMIERILKDIYNADNEWSISVLRYFNPIGAHKSGLIGEDPQGIPNNLLPYITQVAAGRRECLSIFGNDYNTPDGTGVRDYIHVVDLARAHLKAIELAETVTGIDYFNIGTGVGYSVLDIVHAYEKATGIKINYKITARRPGDIDECYANPKKAYEVLGWKAENNIEDMCRDSYNWQRQNPNGYDS
ncbi:MAG: UDP-glucose 4-epimerase GalE [Ruminococcaceae bacterium]|nr:UDP-glucose 4-epimerase GalE [Oscillospiraceae bacterium]